MFRLKVIKLLKMLILLSNHTILILIKENFKFSGAIHKTLKNNDVKIACIKQNVTIIPLYSNF